VSAQFPNQFSYPRQIHPLPPPQLPDDPVHQFVDPVLGDCGRQPGFPGQLASQLILRHASN
jgi:hypothetical protein